LKKYSYLKTQFIPMQSIVNHNYGKYSIRNIGWENRNRKNKEERGQGRKGTGELCSTDSGIIGTKAFYDRK